MLNIKNGIQEMPFLTSNKNIFDENMSRLNKPMFKNQKKNSNKLYFDLGDRRNNLLMLLTFVVVFCLNIVPSST